LSLSIKEAIRAKLAVSMAISHLDINDTTGKHTNHKNFDGGFHLNVIIVSEDFENLNILNRHKLVYKALGSMIKNEIHALSMKTFTIEEWKNHVT
tara:strand:+ start:100 stop:384 length:285 start_codon:yes stop_codon:yes gene_type:complete